MKLKLDWNEIGWRYWVASWMLIAAGIAGWESGFYLVTALSAFQVLHYSVREKSFTAFPVQVRVAFFVLVLVALMPPFRWLYWIPFLGLIARITVNYCLLARLVSLFEWNTSESFSWDLVRRTIFSPPVDGSIIDNRPKL